MTAHTHRILRLPATEQKVGLKRDAIYRGAREGWFPKPVQISARATGWLEHELDAFIASRPRTASPGSARHTAHKAPPLHLTR